jgi:RHS repeat-associated protein
MPQPGRGYVQSASKPYRFGFNGKENDNEVKGKGNQVDFGARVYDPRLVRFLSVDPLTKSYPFNTPYSFAANSPIVAVDQDGEFPVWTHYQMTYQALIRAKIDKATASEIAHYASTYADHPNSGIMKLNKGLALNYLFNPGRLSYDAKKYGSYEKTIQSQSDKLVVSVSIHAMRTYWEDITPDEAVTRALFGGIFKEKDGTQVRVLGAYEVVNSLKGKDLSKISRAEKKLLGLALHTIQDAEIHKGKRWVDDHKDEAEKMGKKNEHPDVKETLGAFGGGNEENKARQKTDQAISTITEKP